MRRVFLIITILLIFFLGVFGGIFYYKSVFAGELTDGNHVETQESIKTSYVCMRVINTTVDNVFSVDGVVTGYQDDGSHLITGRGNQNDSKTAYTVSGTYLKTMAIQNPDKYSTEKNSVSFSVNRGDKVGENDLLVTVGGVPYYAPCSGKIISIKENTGEINIEIFDYSELYIRGKVTYDQYQLIDYNTEVNVTVDDAVYNGAIDWIGYEENNGYFDVFVKCNYDLILGHKVTLEFKSAVTKTGLFVLTDALIQNGDDYYLRKKSGDSYELDHVTVGETVLVNENDYKYSLTEILSGVTENDTVYFITGNADIDAILEYLK